MPSDSDVSDSNLQAPEEHAHAIDSSQADPLVDSTLPTSGPEYFELRRRQWRNVQPKTTSTSKSTSESTSHARLEAVVSSPGYESDEGIWNTYLKNVNERLKAGVTLRKPLPLWVVVSGNYYACEFVYVK
jgi:hypothetical protein